MPTESPRRRPARRHALSGSLVAASVLSAVVSTGYAGCFLPDYAKQSDGATNGTPGATTGNPGSGGAGAAGGAGGSGSGATGGTAMAGSSPAATPGRAALGRRCVTLTTTGHRRRRRWRWGAGGAGAPRRWQGPAVRSLQTRSPTSHALAGNACDSAVDMDMNFVGFQCYGGQNNGELCEACNAPEGEFAAWAAGLHREQCTRTAAGRRLRRGQRCLPAGSTTRLPDLGSAS